MGKDKDQLNSIQSIQKTQMLIDYHKSFYEDSKGIPYESCVLFLGVFL